MTGILALGLHLHYRKHAEERCGSKVRGPKLKMRDDSVVGTVMKAQNEENQWGMWKLRDDGWQRAGPIYIYIFLFCFSLQEGADRLRARWKRREVSLGTDFLYCKRRRAPWIHLYSSFWEPCVCHLQTSLSILFLFFFLLESFCIEPHCASDIQRLGACWAHTRCWEISPRIFVAFIFFFFYFSLILYDMSTGHLFFFRSFFVQDNVKVGTSWLGHTHLKTRFE